MALASEGEHMKKEIFLLVVSFAVLAYMAVFETNSCAAEHSLGADEGTAVVSAPTTPPEIPSAPETKADPASPPVLNTDAVNIGALVLYDVDNNLGGMVYTEFEKRLARRFSLFARLGWINYQSDDDEELYREYGRGSGLELGFRVYPVLKETKNFYLGAAIGRWRLKWNWKDEAGTPFETSGRRYSRFTSIQVHCGWKFVLGSSGVYLNPTGQIGTFSPRKENDPIEFGGLVTSAGIVLGMAW